MKPPFIHGTLTHDGRLVEVTCPHCGGRHLHGAAGIIDGSNPHRIAHCKLPPHVRAVGYVVLMPEGRE